jgi:hypothetical protein
VPQQGFGSAGRIVTFSRVHIRPLRLLSRTSSRSRRIDRRSDSIDVSRAFSGSSSLRTIARASAFVAICSTTCVSISPTCLSVVSFAAIICGKRTTPSRIENDATGAGPVCP